MDSKIILAVLIVALIGIVAATYQSETNDIMNSLANVATEDSDVAESVTDLAEASGEGANSVQVDESIVQPDSSVNSKVVSTPKSTNNQQNPTTSNSNSGNSQNTPASNTGSSSNTPASNTNSSTGTPTSNSNSSTGTNSQSNTNTQQSNSSSNNNQNQESGITETEAMSIAKNNLPEGMTSDYQKVSETTINGEKYYDVNLYKDGEIIASAEINSHGNITGGAIVGEAPSV